jgi:hypothetical protein
VADGIEVLVLLRAGTTMEDKEDWLVVLARLLASLGELLLNVGLVLA